MQSVFLAGTIQVPIKVLDRDFPIGDTTTPSSTPRVLNGQAPCVDVSPLARVFEAKLGKLAKAQLNEVTAAPPGDRGH